MKKLLCLSMLACLIYAGCKNPSSTASGSDTSSKAPVTQSASADSTEKILGRDISPEELKMLVDNYKANNKPNADAPLTTSVWFSYDEMKDMVDQLTKERSSGSTMPDGVRIYFGTYPKAGEHGMNYNHPGQNTLIFVSTATGVSTTDGHKPNHVNYYSETNRDFMMNPYNRGQLCEPSCDDDTIVIPQESAAKKK